MLQRILNGEAPVAYSKGWQLKMDNRNNLIDLLRIIAAVAVVLFHVNNALAFRSNWYNDIVYQGYLGVPVFFVISGYCIYYAAHHAKTSSGFLIRRLFRILPAYWFSVLLTVVCLVAYYTIHAKTDIPVPKTFAHISDTIFLFTDPVTSYKAINYAYWTLSYELCFYLLIFAGLLLPSIYRLLWLIVISIATILLPKHDQWPLFFIQYWPYFCLGMVIFRLLHCLNEYLWLNLLLLAATIAGFFYLATPLATIITGMVTGVLIVVNHFKPLKNNWFSKLGNYSYSVYLIHVPVCVFLLGDIKKTKLLQHELWLSITWDAAMVVLAIYLSKFVYNYVELPFIQAGKNIANKYQKRLMPSCPS